MDMGCSHLKEYKSEYGLQAYETLHGFFVLDTISSSYHQVLATCFDCEAYNSHRLLACMHCVFFGCFNKHATEHSNYSSHNLFVELSNGHVYCHSCHDYTYDSDVENISARQRLTSSLPGPSRPPENKVLLQHSKKLKVDSSTFVGLRGLVNFGCSCFMNSIMQALLHTSVLRDYFFTDKHKCHGRESKDCMFCHLYRLYQEYYTEYKFEGLSLHDIFYLVWQYDSYLAGDEQKDAHEFLISFLSILNLHSCNPSQSPSSKSFVDLTFHGEIQSDLMCQSCRFVSTKIDPFSDVSLEIPDGPQKDADLLHCLHHFTRCELLEFPDDKSKEQEPQIRCSNCQSTAAASTKQLTFRVLPVVMIIHLKRFKRENDVHKKKMLYVSFPMELDMSPYTTSLRNSNQMPLEKWLDPNSDNRYSLYAVLVHAGDSINSGHYFTYIRRTKNSWFKCSDLIIKPALTTEVLKSEGYLLFYQKTSLL